MQLSAYAHAVTVAAAEPVVRAQLLFLAPAGSSRVVTVTMTEDWSSGSSLTPQP